MSEQNPQLDAINAALAAAKSAAANAVPTPQVVSNAVAPHVASQVAPGRPVSMREMLAESGMAVDKYIRVEKAGFFLGEDKTIVNAVTEMLVEFKFSEAKAFYSLRYGANPTKYSKSFDRIVDAKTKRPWDMVIAQAQAMDPKCTGDYRALDLPFRLVEDVMNMKGDAVLLEAGKRVGWTSSVTNWKIWAEFSKPFFDLMDVGVVTEDTVFRGKIVHKQETKNGNTWGLLTFSDFVAVGFEADQAA